MKDTDGFQQAKELAKTVTSGCYRRSIKETGEPSNYKGYKHIDGSLWVICDSVDDIPESMEYERVVDGCPLIKIS